MNSRTVWDLQLPCVYTALSDLELHSLQNGPLFPLLEVIKQMLKVPKK